MAESSGRLPISSALQSTLLRAREYAAGQSQPEVLLEHLMLALTEDPDAMHVLTACNVDSSRLRSDLAGYIADLQDRVPQGTPPAISTALTQVLKYATLAAQQGKRDAIDGAIVLAALIGDGRSMAANYLKAQGLTFEAAIQALREAAQRSAQQAEPAPAAPPAEAEPTAAASQAEQPAAHHPIAAPEPHDAGAHGDAGPSTATATSQLDLARQRVASRMGPAPGQRNGATAAGIAPHAEAPPQPQANAAMAHEVEPPGGQVRQTGAPLAPPGHYQSDSLQPERQAGAPHRVPAPPVEQAGGPQSGRNPPPQQTLANDPPTQNPGPAVGRSWPQGTGETPKPAPPPHDRDAEPPIFATEPARPVVGHPDAGPAGGHSQGASSAPGFRQQAGARASMPPSGPRPGTAGSAPAALPAPFPTAPHRQGLAAGRELAPTQPPHSPSAPQRPPAPQARSGSGLAPPDFEPHTPYRPTGPGPVPPNPFGDTRGEQPLQPAPPTVRMPHHDRPTDGPGYGVGLEAHRVPPMDSHQLAHNIGGPMRVGQAKVVEVRIERPPLAGGGVGTRSVALRGEHAVARAIAVRVRPVKGRFLIDATSPETLWDQTAANQQPRFDSDTAIWRLTILPQKTGRGALQLSVTTRTIGADGVVAETQLPETNIPVKVMPDIGRWFRRLTKGVLLLLGGMFAVKILETLLQVDFGFMLRQLLRF
ncbi:MAG: Clp protease N-terminal domain-containing protein [Hyphomicrobiaceae bacterium]